MQSPPKEKPADDPLEPAGRADDEQKGSYYYDDAHGYETYKPDDETGEPEPDSQKL